MLACITLFFIEPYHISILVYKLFYNIAAYFWYNFTWLWGVIDETFGFTRDGVLTALARMFSLFEFMVTDYETFTERMADNIWKIAAVLLFWPIYVAWIWFVWIFDLDVNTSLW